MGKNEKTPITVDGVDYMFEDMSATQQTMVNHIRDLDRKLAAARFNVDQLTVGKQAFVDLLRKSLTESEHKEEE